MKLTKLYVRFFRSFNFDYERKANPNATPQDWERIDGAWFPFVRVDLDPAVTAIVGANESGKSHLIKALEQALTGTGISRADFCRYSPLFSVETGKVRTPDLGVEFELGPDDVPLFGGELVDTKVGSRFTLVRLNGGENILVDSSGTPQALNKKHLDELEARLPAPFRLATFVPLPDSVTLDALLDRPPQPLRRRRDRFDFLNLFRGLADTTPASITPHVDQMARLLARGAGDSDAEDDVRIASDQLGRSLLRDIAQIDKSSFEDLEDALREGEEGRVGGLIEEMNRSLARHLNFSRWWRQDPDFQLRISPRERELTVHDPGSDRNRLLVQRA